MMDSVLHLQWWIVKRAPKLCTGKSPTQHYLLLISKVYYCSPNVSSFLIKCLYHEPPCLRRQRKIFSFDVFRIYDLVMESKQGKLVN